MLQLKINSISLDLDPSTAVTVNLNSPLFDRERIFRTWSYPFKLPATPSNVRAFGHAQRLDSGALKRKYSAQLYIAGNLFEAGVLKITSVNPKWIEVVFQNKPIGILEEMRTLKLQYLSMPVTVAGAEYAPTVYIQYLSPPPGETFAVGINGRLYERPSAELASIIDDINADFPGLASYNTIPGSNFTVDLDTAALPTLQVDVEPAGASPGALFFTFGQLDITSELAYRAAWQAAAPATVPGATLPMSFSAHPNGNNLRDKNNHHKIFTMKNLSTKQLEFFNELRKLNTDQAEALLNFLKLVNGTSSTPANGGDAETEKAFRKTIDAWLNPGSEKKFVG